MKACSFAVLAPKAVQAQGQTKPLSTVLSPLLSRDKQCAQGPRQYRQTCTCWWSACCPAAVATERTGTNTPKCGCSITGLQCKMRWGDSFFSNKHNRQSVVVADALSRQDTKHTRGGPKPSTEHRVFPSHALCECHRQNRKRKARSMPTSAWPAAALSICRKLLGIRMEAAWKLLLGTFQPALQAAARPCGAAEANAHAATLSSQLPGLTSPLPPIPAIPSTSRIIKTTDPRSVPLVGRIVKTAHTARRNRMRVECAQTIPTAPQHDGLKRRPAK